VATGHHACRRVRATTWHGRRGTVLLGPTEHRVARWLADMTRAGRVTIRTVDLARELRVERSEAYRITRRLRILGLFGIENDQGGTQGGRRYWRTSIEHDGGGLDPVRHHTAWARVLGWARARRDRLTARLAAASSHHMTVSGVTAPGRSDRLIGHRSPDPAPASRGDAGATFAGQMRRAGLGRLMDGWGVR